MITLRKGTKLYRAAKSPEVSLRHCDDTDKTGAYFAIDPLTAIAMSLEYNKSMSLSVYELTSAITFTEGKYSFRDIHPERYYNKSGEVKPGVDLKPDENINHIDYKTNPLNHEMEPIQLYFKQKHGEVFIANQKDLDKVKLIDTKYIKLDKLKKFVDNHTNIVNRLGTFESIFK
jgi:hypothetical protein